MPTLGDEDETYCSVSAGYSLESDPNDVTASPSGKEDATFKTSDDKEEEEEEDRAVVAEGASGGASRRAVWVGLQADTIADGNVDKTIRK